MTLAVAVCAVVHDNKILLLKRTRGDYVGLLALPGGKVENNEHVSFAGLRELKEETEIEAEFVKHLDIVSEILIDGKERKHLLLNICLLKPLSTKPAETKEALLWHDLGKLKDIEGEIIPSDLKIIERIIITREKSYFECIMEKSGNKHKLLKFE